MGRISRFMLAHYVDLCTGQSIQRKDLFEVLICCEMYLQAAFLPNQTLDEFFFLSIHASPFEYTSGLCGSLNLAASLREEVQCSSNQWGTLILEST